MNHKWKELELSSKILKIESNKQSFEFNMNFMTENNMKILKCDNCGLEILENETNLEKCMEKQTRELLEK